MEVVQRVVATETHGNFFRKRYPACFPVAMAAMSGNMNMVELLVKNGAEIDQQDEEYGHSTMHSYTLVDTTYHAQSKPSFTGNIKDFLNSDCVMLWWVRKASKKTHGHGQAPGLLKRYLLQLRNKAGENALQFASTQGCHAMVKTILEIDGGYRFPQWRCGQTSRMLYDVTEVAPNLPQMKDEESVRDSVLETLVYNTERPYGQPHDVKDGLAWCNIAAIRKIMDLRWRIFRLPIFVCILLHLALMISFTITVIHSEKRCDTAGQNHSEITHANTTLCPNGQFAPWFISLLVVEYFFITLYIISEVASVYNICRRRRYKPWSDIISSIVYKEGLFGAILLIFVTCMVLALVFLLADCLVAFNAVMSLAALSGWSFLLIYTRVFQEISTFTIMLQRIMIGNLFHFTVVFVIIAVGFATALRTVFWGEPSPNELGSFGQLLKIMFQTMMTAEPPELETAPSQSTHQFNSANALFSIFVVVASIQLLNLLIAALSDSYAEVSTKKVEFWLQNREKVVLFFERRLVWIDLCRQDFVKEFVTLDIPMAELETTNKNIEVKGKTRRFLPIEELLPQQ